MPRFLLKEYFPKLVIHASTQMANHNSVGANFSKRIGFSRVILARELTMPELVGIQKEAKIETEIFREFFQSLSQAAGFTLHVENLYGTNTHHILESCFKSLAISLREAIKIDLQNSNNIPSTKGTLSGSN